MSNLVWQVDTPFDKIVVPDPATTGATVNSSPFRVPKGAHSVTFHGASTAHTFTIQALTPALDNQQSDSWLTVSALVGVTATALTGIGMNGIAITYPASVLPGGWLRLVSSSSEAGAPITIWVVYHMQP